MDVRNQEFQSKKFADFIKEGIKDISVVDCDSSWNSETREYDKNMPCVLIIIINSNNEKWVINDRIFSMV